MKLLDSVLFNIILDDIDKDLDAKLPSMKYVRFLHFYLFAFTDLFEMYNSIGIINEIFINHSFLLFLSGFKASHCYSTISNGKMQRPFLVVSFWKLPFLTYMKLNIKAF